MRQTLLALLLCLMIASHPAAAHPHLFINAGVGLVFTGNEVAGIHVRWKWDEWWSEEVTGGCDRDRNGKFSASENEAVRRDFFDGARDVGYFTKVRVNGKKVAFGNAKDFRATILSDGCVAYELTLFFKKNEAACGAIEITFNDDTIYTAFDEEVDIIGDATRIKRSKSEIYEDFGVRVTLDL